MFGVVPRETGSLFHENLLSVYYVQTWLRFVELASAHVIIDVSFAVVIGIDAVYSRHVDAFHIYKVQPRVSRAICLQCRPRNIERRGLALGIVKAVAVNCWRNRVQRINRSQAAAKRESILTYFRQAIGERDRSQAGATIESEIIYVRAPLRDDKVSYFFPILINRSIS